MTIALHILAHLATAILTLLIVLQLGLATPSARIVEIDAERALRYFEGGIGEMSEAAFREETRVFLEVMQILSDDLAKARGVIVVEAELAIAGARDVTDELVARALTIMTETPQNREGS